MFQVKWPQGSFDLCQINTKLGQLLYILGIFPISQAAKNRIESNSSKTQQIHRIQLLGVAETVI